MISQPLPDFLSMLYRFGASLLIYLTLSLTSGCSQDLTSSNRTGLPLSIEQALVQQGVSWLPQPIPITNHEFINHNGQSLTTHDLKGKWTLAFFGFTFCPDICPMTLSKISKAKRLALSTPTEQSSNGTSNKPSNEPSDVQVVLISVDPARDKPEALGPYLSYFGDDIIGLTGNEASLAKLSTQLHAFYSKANYDQSGANEISYSMDHSANITVISPTGDYLGYISPPHSIEQMSTIIQILGRLQPVQ